MKIDSLLLQLDQIKTYAEIGGDDLIDGEIAVKVIDTLLEYISNDKIKEKVDEIPF